MLQIKKLTGILLAVAMVTLSCVSVLAADGGYTETAVSLPNITVNGNPMGFFVKPDGSMDYLFSVTDRQGRGQSSTVYHHKRSIDGGKTWDAQDMSWAKGMASGGAAMDKNGAVYWAIDGGNVDLQDEEGTAGFPTTKFIKVVDGKVQAVPNVHLKSSRFNYCKILGISNSGELAVLGTPWKYGAKSAICLVNPKTGASKETEYDFSPVFFTDSVIGGATYGAVKKFPRKNGNGYSSYAPLEKIVVYDRAMGKQTATMALQDDTKVTFQEDGSPAFDSESSVLTADSDGTVYYADKNGIFRCAVGGSSFEKIIDAANFSAEKGNMHMSYITAVNGKLYIESHYFNAENPNDPKNMIVQKLFIYSPT